MEYTVKTNENMKNIMTYSEVLSTGTRAGSVSGTGNGPGYKNIGMGAGFTTYQELVTVT